jgi:superfamily II DNA or RNA helicase
MKVGCHSINSKVGTANLDLFNTKKIKHIAAVGMLDEGANLVDCKIGIFQMINSSDRLNIQRVGRILRHKSPVLIFPYFVDTREEEIVKDVTAGYNTELITEIDCTNPINLLVKGVELKKYING